MILKDESKIVKKPKVLVHFHLYYHNQLNFMLRKLGNICNCEWNLIVTACEINDKLVRKIKGFKPDAEIILVENKGYDIWPFIQVLNKVDLKNYDFILKIHTKNFRKNFKYFGYGYTWRNLLIDGILKNKKRFAENIKILCENPEIGLIQSKPVVVPMGDNDSEDNTLFYEVCTRYNLSVEKGYFVAGTMFIARADSYEIIKNMNLTEADFCCQQRTNDKQTVAHVVERLLSRVVETDNRKIYTIPNRKYKVYKFLLETLKNVFAVRNEVNGYSKKKYICLLGIKFYIS